MREEASEITTLRIAVIAAALAAVYWAIAAKLASDWWTDENYSHGLLIPFVIAAMIWAERERIAVVALRPAFIVGVIACFAAVLILLGGVVGAELFSQRISFVLLTAGIVIYFAGWRMLNLLLVPFALLLLAIPIPQILFNRIAFPLQMLASQVAVWTIRLAEVPTTRNGNIIDILPRGATQTISLEVVEACSGIRSLMTLMTLALVLGYLTRSRPSDGVAGMPARDLTITIILVIAAIPIAVLTNALRVAATGYLTYAYGRTASEGLWHDASGWAVYAAALAMLIGLNFILKKLTGKEARGD